MTMHYSLCIWQEGCIDQKDVPGEMNAMCNGLQVRADKNRKMGEFHVASTLMCGSE